MLKGSLTYRVPYADTDQMGVVYYANFLVFFERSRNEFFREIDYPYSIMEDQGIMLPVVEAHVDYKAPALYDDLLTITARIAQVKGCRIRIENEIYNEQGKLLCTGYTVHCFIGKENRRPVKAPASLLEFKKNKIWRFCLSRLENTIAAIDQLHSQDPEKVDGIAKELIYAQRMTSWLSRLEEAPCEELSIAVRSQHLCRWEIPRKDFPMDRPGYLKWRTELGKLHAEKAAECMQANGYDEETIARTKSIIRKQNLKTNPAAQTMEDCACLVFIEYDFLPFAEKHSEEKIISIVRKTWNKMSEKAQQAALKLQLPEQALGLIQKALG